MPGDDSNDSDDAATNDPYRTPGAGSDPNRDGRNPALNLLEAWHVDNLTSALNATKSSVDKLTATVNKLGTVISMFISDRSRHEQRQEDIAADIVERLDRIEAAL